MEGKTWREIPIKDIETMLSIKNAKGMWGKLWGDLTGNGYRHPPKGRAFLTYLFTVILCVSSPEGDSPRDLDAFFNSFEDVLKPIFDLINWDGDAGEPWTKKYKHYLHAIAEPKRDEPLPDDDTNTTKEIMDAMDAAKEKMSNGSFYQAVFVAEKYRTSKDLLLGSLIDTICNWTVAYNNTPDLNNEPNRFKQRDLEEGKHNLEEKIAGSGLYEIWNNWHQEQRKQLEDKIKAIPAGEVALEYLEQGAVKQIIFNGAPGTGKSYLSELLARYLGAKLPGAEHPYVRVQFHPSYDYTDFVEGLRPVKEGDSLTYGKLDGHFKKFCRQVVKKGDSDKKYFFLIDEINRADLSKVFGELMYCLEADKRGPDHTVNTQYQNLPTYDPQRKGDLPEKEDAFAADGFYIPENVYILGTMNDIDRSVESMDFALRRRFVFMELGVTEENLEQAFQSKKMGFESRIAKLLAADVAALNKTIEQKGKDYGLGPDYFISAGQFSGLPVKKDNLNDVKNFVWKFRIEPLLREYLRGEGDVDKFIEDCRTDFIAAGDKKP